MRRIHTVLVSFVELDMLLVTHVQGDSIDILVHGWGVRLVCLGRNPRYAPVHSRDRWSLGWTNQSYTPTYIRLYYSLIFI